MALMYIPLVLVSLATLLYYYFRRNFNYWKDRGVAGPEPVALFGNMMDSTLLRKNVGAESREMYEAFPNEKVVGVYRMTTPALLIRDLDIVKHIMIKDFDNFADRGIEFSKKGLGANLFHADGDTWRVLRNRFTPIFTTGKLKNMMYLMTERAEKFLSYVEDISSKETEQEVHKMVQKFTMSTIAACAFGLELDTYYGKNEILGKIDDIVLGPKPLKNIVFMYPNIMKKLNLSLLPRLVTDFFYDLVKTVTEQRGGVPSNRHDFMDLILELKQKGEIEGTKRNASNELVTVDITDSVMAAQAFVFYVGGYETSATTMSFMLYHLAKNPHVQEKLLAEIDQVLAKHNGQLTYECMSEMVYLEKVFDETLRLYPIVEPLQRKALAEYKVPGTNVVIEKGQSVLVSAFGIHHDAKYYPDPEKFDPERFCAENSKDRHSCAYIPFGVGPRHCIGMRFAKAQSRVCMIKLLSKFRVEVSKNTQKVMEIDERRPILGPKGGVRLNVIKRN